MPPIYDRFAGSTGRRRAGDAQATRRRNRSSSSSRCRTLTCFSPLARTSEDARRSVARATPRCRNQTAERAVMVRSSRYLTVPAVVLILWSSISDLPRNRPARSLWSSPWLRWSSRWQPYTPCSGFHPRTPVPRKRSPSQEFCTDTEDLTALKDGHERLGRGPRDPQITDRSSMQVARRCRGRRATAATAPNRAPPWRHVLAAISPA
jgi:hypothetical protein